MVLTCTHCQSKLRAPPGAEGKKIQCPKCRAALQVPGPAATPATPAADTGQPVVPAPPRENKAPGRLLLSEPVAPQDLPLLGKELGRVYADSSLFLMMTGGAVLLALVGVFCLGMSLFRANKLTLTLLGLGCIVGGGLLAMLFLRLHRQQRQHGWLLLEKGIVEFAGDQNLLSVLWDDVKNINVEYAVSTKTSEVLAFCTIELGMSPQSQVFTNQEFNSSALSQILFTARRQVPARGKDQVVAAVRQGKPVQIGPFTLDRSGLSWNGRTHSWDRIRGVSHRIFFLLIDLEQGEQAETEVSMLEFENLGELLAVVENCSRRTPAESMPA